MLLFSGTRICFWSAIESDEIYFKTRGNDKGSFYIQKNSFFLKLNYKFLTETNILVILFVILVSIDLDSTLQNAIIHLKYWDEKENLESDTYFKLSLDNYNDFHWTKQLWPQINVSFKYAEINGLWLSFQ